MNKKHIQSGIVVVLLAVLTALVWFWRHNRTAKEHRGQGSEKPAIFATNGTVISNTVAIAASSSVGLTNDQKTNDSNRSPEAIRQYMESQNKPIEFYGRIIDQNGDPVSGAKVKIGVRHWNVVVPAPWGAQGQTIGAEKETDIAGRFEFHDITGDGFGIGITKDGYLLSPKTPRGFGPTAGSFESPIIIKMWKLSESQHLISHHLSRIGIPVDGQSVQFDLVNGKKVSSGGQLTVRLKRDPQVLPQRYGRYDWSLELAIPNGGLVATNDEFMYQAPESGYQETFKFDMPKTAEDWTTTIEQPFYIQLENEKYFGSFVVRINTIHDTPPLGINLDIVINANGSRNLQP